MKEIGSLYVVSPEPDRDIVEKIIEAGKCGADIIQIRSKKLNQDDLIAVVRYVKERIPENIVLIVNDYPEIAMASGADGIHGGQSDFELEDIKFFKERYNLIVGVSAYDSVKRGMLAEKYGADYVAFSSPFPSPSKEKVITPEETIKKAIENISIPVFVIGGINARNARKLLELGVHGLAVLSYAFSGNTCENIKKLRIILERYAL